MNTSNSLFFIALLPPPEILAYAEQIKQHFADRYNSRAAQKSPPHITLHSPFEWADPEISILKQSLSRFANTHKSVKVNLSGFGAFPPRIIYMNVRKTHELMALHSDLLNYTTEMLGITDSVYQQRPFIPHLTVAFRDLTRQNFQSAWAEFGQRKLRFDFTIYHLTLLIHDSKRWNIAAEFPFSDSP